MSQGIGLDSPFVAPHCMSYLLTVPSAKSTIAIHTLAPVKGVKFSLVCRCTCIVCACNVYYLKQILFHLI